MTTVTEPTPAEVADILDKAADHIDCVGWHQGYLYDEDAAETGERLEDCPVCAMGAINGAVYGVPRYPAKERDLSVLGMHAEDALKRFLKVLHVPLWNDEANRKKAEVVAALRDTAAGLRAEAA